jgi:hydroxymethylpyrimidine pyrophosphatase-like HAD family hydrolase
MVQKADLGIAMGNAESELIEVADLIIGSCEESGILKFVVELEEKPDMLNIKR